MTCPHCRAELPPNARFCPSCAHGVSADVTRTSAEQHPPASGLTPPSDSFDHGRFAPGTLIGERYRIVARLGVGGMGEVYRADDLTLGQAVALKFLPEAVERDAGRLDKFTAEVRTARQIAHPNVCRVYDVGEVDGRRFLTMEYVDGEDLQSLLRRVGRFPEDKGLEVARQICAGLAAMHDRDVLHRDLKPANIMIDGRGRVRLTDFGLATAVAGAGTDGEIAGTPAYMAPEQFAGQPLTPATDLYALGLVLFELFTGERVQKGADVHAIRSAQHTVAQTLTSSGSGAKLDPLVQRVIERCLDPDPKRRPQSAVVIAAALPGGDPLAAALAAGETPSPQMVAAAGEAGGLSFKVAVPMLALVVITIGLTIAGAIQRAGQLPPFPHSPEVLAFKAREIIERFGYSAVDSVTGFRTYATTDYEAWLAQQVADGAPSPDRDLADLRPSTVRFWFRGSLQTMVPNSFLSPPSVKGGVAPNISDPPFEIPGMTYVELDSAGRLEKFRAVAPVWNPGDGPHDPPDWRMLFDAAGLEFEAFAGTKPEWFDGLSSDTHVAWTGPGGDASGSPLRVEAAAFQGQVVSFILYNVWDRVTLPQSLSLETGPGLFILVIMVVFAAVNLSAVVLAVRSVKAGRSDLRGATRLVVAVGALTLAGGLTGSRLSSPGELLLGWMILVSWAAFVALMTWVLYAAIEPHVRRRWPAMLITWARLLEGRWRDPRLGRDLLIGTSTAAVLAMLFLVRPVLRSWAGIAPVPEVPTMESSWTYPSIAVAGLLGQLGPMLILALGLIVLLVVFRIVLRSERRAAVGLVVAMGLLGWATTATQGQGDVVGIVCQAIGAAIFVFVATRYGLVALIGLYWFNIAPSTLILPYGVTAAVVTNIVLLLLPAVFGFYTATRGRAAVNWLEE